MIKPLSSVTPEYNLFMGYWTGVQKKWWYGIKDITSIFMGAWNDSLIGYDGYAINASLIEDMYWDEYNDMYPAPDYKSPEYQEYEAKFSDFMLKNAERIKSDINEILENYKEELEAVA